MSTVSFHNFKSQNFKLSVSNPNNTYVAYVSILSQISNCQGLGRKNKFEILKTDPTPNLPTNITPTNIARVCVCMCMYGYVWEVSAPRPPSSPRAAPPPVRGAHSLSLSIYTSLSLYIYIYIHIMRIIVYISLSLYIYIYIYIIVYNGGAGMQVDRSPISQNAYDVLSTEKTNTDCREGGTDGH